MDFRVVFDQPFLATLTAGSLDQVVLSKCEQDDFLYLYALSLERMNLHVITQIKTENRNIFIS